MSIHRFRSRAISAATACAVALAAAVAVRPAAQAVDLSSEVVLSEVYGGGGNSGAPYANDFVELYNRGAAAQSIDGWSVQYTSAAGTNWQTTPLTGSVPAGGYYLVAESAGGGSGAALPAPDAIGTLNLSGSNGKVALVSTGVALAGCAADCDNAAGVIDFVGFGSADDAAGTPTPALSNSTSAQRTVDPFTNTGNNATDFSIGTPTPGVPGLPPAPAIDCSQSPTPTECVPGAVTIQDIQGDGFRSPLRGTAVDRVAGVVTASRNSGTSRGFWIQQPAPDPGRVAASSGVFVYTATATVSVGDLVVVSGTVSDYYPLGSGETVATTANLSITEITPTTITRVSAGNPLPAPLVLGSATVPDQYAPAVTGGNIEAIGTVDPANSALEFYEAHEGMLVQLDDARVVGPGQPQYNEIYLTSKPDQQATPRGGTYLAGYATVPSGRLLVAPVNGVVPPANVGDQLLGVTSGPLDWSLFGGYEIAATVLGGYQNNNLSGTVATEQAADQLAIATYNVENLAPGDPQSKYDRLAAGVVDNLKSPDIISVEEIQDNSGATDNGVVAADQTLAKLVAAISSAGGPDYETSAIDPTNDADGGQPGGNIRTVFLFNPARVTLVSKPGGNSTTAVTVNAGSVGTAELSLSPGRVDPTNAAWTASRKPLAAEFRFGGKQVIVIGNHFNSKGGDQNADGRFQPPTHSSEVQRTQQAAVLNGFVKQILAVDPSANVVLAGDFNDYQFSGPITTLTDDGATLTDLVNTLPVEERYTYIFNGISQVLDHIFVSKPLFDAGAVEYDVIHSNSEFSDQVSDHDPQVVRIRPVAHPAALPGTVTLDPSTVRAGQSISVTLTGWDPAAELTVSLDSAELAKVSTDGVGFGTADVVIPISTAVGSHTISAITAAGMSSSVELQVLPACVPFPGRHATLAELLRWLLALLTGPACEPVG